jgi:iron complex transport system substrate-binding protein
VDPSFILEARGRRFLARGAAFLAVLILAAGCAGPPGSSTRPSGGEPIGSELPSPTATPAATAVVFPIVVTDDEDTAVSIPAEPQKIVTLTAASTETVFALGLGDRVVGKDSASDFPAEATSLPDVGAFGTVDIEQIVDLGADLVIAGGNGDTPPDGIVRMRSLGIPVVVVYAGSFDAVFTDIELIALATGHPAEGEALVALMRDEIQVLTAAIENRERPRVFYEIDATVEIYGPADESFLAEMLVLAGADPITSGSGASFEIPLERLVEADPEVIVLGDAAFGTTADVVRERPGWGSMTAVREGAIRPTDDKLITRPGPRIAQGLRSLILAIHPDAVLP